VCDETIVGVHVAYASVRVAISGRLTVFNGPVAEA